MAREWWEDKQDERPDVGTDERVWLRFGRDHDRPCKEPWVLTCARWAC